MEREIELEAVVFGRAPGSAVASVLELDRGARIRRAARVALPLFAAALLSVPIPGWHLAAVPGFLIASGVFGVRRMRQARLVRSVAGACPACRENVAYAVPGYVRLPDAFPCPRCHEFVRLREV